MSHSPPPWTIVRGTNDTGDEVFYIQAVNEHGHTVTIGEAEREADARMMVAAPKLLGFVQNLRDLAEGEAWNEVIAECRGDYCRDLLALEQPARPTGTAEAVSHAMSIQGNEEGPSQLYKKVGRTPKDTP